ncbi:McrB family protein [Enterococcus hirae]|uniref:McrB family protein n=1 Tax=Enterococcus hirae TaxID=1354 RepID=UPI001E35CECA|nr:AAA family ATPase [Enterococcus hirae]MCD5088528.1 AAA family ATPase [Enterococcus hirae]UYT95867.1 AAA family ATPase [Enterococcus hirae]UYT97384.1 AAA family ATPase [Enterococcus hirae]UYU00920.1 AAA family ATPase [Enterococcus hirae]
MKKAYLLTEEVENVSDKDFSLNETAVDIETIVKYLEVYSGKKYINPEKAGAEKAKMEQFKKSGKKARQEFIKIGEIIEKFLPDFKVGRCTDWINQGQKGYPYFWVEFKRKDALNLPHSLSLSINVHPEHDPSGPVTLSFRVELKDTEAEDEDYAIHNKIVEIPLNESSGIFYQANMKSNNESLSFSDKSENVKKEIENNSIKKLKTVKNIDGPYVNSNISNILEDSIKAAKLLMPFYEYILSLKGITINSKEEEKMTANDIGLNTILYGPPGTGKTYNTAIYAVSICDGRTLEEVKADNYEEVMSRYNNLMKDERIAFTTFHQSYGYEEFIEGIKPIVDTNSNDIGYKIEPGIFKSFCNKASNKKIKDGGEENTNPCVFIIDEINRGNISKIFGELITLIEDTRRLNMDEETSAILPYSGTRFSIPSNVYILGTMNTADRSISLMDTALRRRFRFIEMMPDSEVLRQIGADKVDTLDVALMLEKINERIAYLYDREHTIGHAFFTKLKTNPNLETLESIFRESVMPLLQEYFYEDYEKIQLVLGDNGKSDPKYKFIIEEDLKYKEVFKGDTIDTIDLPEKKYQINDEAFSCIESYKEII